MATADEIKVWLDTFWPDKLTQQSGLAINKPTILYRPTVYLAIDTKEVFVWIVDTWVDLTTQAAGAGHILQDEGIDLPARANINFTGDAVTASDNAGADSTDVTINHQDISGKSDVGHIHDDRYYTDVETDSLLNTKPDRANVIEKGNTTPYTPSLDYEPATRKYVLDNVGGSGTNTDATNQTIAGGVGEVGKVYYLTNTDATWLESDHMVEYTCNGLIGVCSGLRTISFEGLVFLPSHNLGTNGRPLYIGLSGLLTSIEPRTTDHISRIVAYIEDSDNIRIKISHIWLTLN